MTPSEKDSLIVNIIFLEESVKWQKRRDIVKVKYSRSFDATREFLLNFTVEFFLTKLFILSS